MGDGRLRPEGWREPGLHGRQLSDEPPAAAGTAAGTAGSLVLRALAKAKVSTASRKERAARPRLGAAHGEPLPTEAEGFSLLMSDKSRSGYSEITADFICIYVYIH